MPHKWQRGEDVVACYVSRYGYRNLDEWTDVRLADLFGMSADSFRMRQRNFTWLSEHGPEKLTEGFGGNYAKMSAEVWSEYEGIERADHLAEVKRYIESRQPT